MYLILREQTYNQLSIKESLDYTGHQQVPLTL